MTPTSFTVHWQKATGTPDPVYITQWRVAGTTPWISNPAGTTSALQQLVTGLTPNTLYDVRVQASNVAGVNYSVVVQQLTLSGSTVVRDHVAPIAWTAPLAESANDATLNSTSGQIVDAVGAVWTLVNGTGLVVDRNGVAAGFSQNVILLLYHGKTIYQENSSNLWYSWNGTGWDATSDPRTTVKPAESPNNTTLTSTSGTIVDTAGVTWTLVSGTGLQAARNGTADASTTNTQTLLYYNHSVYRQTTGGAWYQWTGSAWTALTTDPRNQTILLGSGATITDAAGVVWSLLNVSGGEAARNGAADTSITGVSQLAYISTVMWRNVASQGLWWSWNGSTWQPPAGTATSPLGTVTRNPWDHPGGAGSAWNTPVGDGATFGLATDLDTIDIARGWNGSAYTAGPVGIINPASNYGTTSYIGKSTDSTYKITSSNNGRTTAINATMPDSGSSITATLHIPTGAVSPGPLNGGDNSIVIYDPVTYPARQYTWAFPIASPGLQPGQGPFTSSQGEWDDATSDQYGEDAETGLNGYNVGAGLITGYDTDPARNPAYPEIHHAFRYSTDAYLLKDNGTPAGSQTLKADSWPQRLQDGQSGLNLYKGNLKAGTTLAIPSTTTMPTGLNANQQGLFRSMQKYPSFFRDQAGGGFHYTCDQVADTSQWMTDARAVFPQLVALLRPMRNQHQTGQSFTTYPKNGPGNRLDAGPPPLAGATTPTPTPTPTPTATETADGTSITTVGPTINASPTPGTAGAGNLIAITSGGQISVNNVVAAGTANVVQLYYTGHTAYQYNGTNWYAPITTTTTGGQVAAPAGVTPTPTPTPTPPSSYPAYNHVVIVVMENHGYSEIVGNTANAPYINSLLASSAVFTNFSAVAHPSEPNYFALYGGSTFGITDDGVYTETDPSLSTALSAKSKTFTGYVDSGSPQKHNPWESFPEGTTVEKAFSTWPTDFSTLPNVSFVVPNLNNDMHDGTILQGDTWLKNNLDSYIQWAKTNNSLFILTFDEDDSSTTTNQVLTLISGANVVAGNYSTALNHYSTLATVLNFYSATLIRNAATATLYPIAAFSNPASTNQVVGPLTGAVTTGSWVAVDITVPGVQLPSGKSVHFCYLLPAQYDPKKLYAVVVWLHPTFATQWYNAGSTEGATDLCFADANGFYNNVSFRTNYPAICVVGYADQTSGNDAVDNWGGWTNNGTTGSGTKASGDTGPNTFGMINGVIPYVISKLSGDPNRVYLEGFSLGGIGAEYMALKFNMVNGNPKRIAAAMSTGGVVEINGFGTGPTASDVTAMTNVPTWWVSGAQDGTSKPGDWNDPAWTALAKNSNYPAPGGTLAQARAGTSQYHYWKDPNIGHQQTNSSGVPYPTNKTILDFLFAQGLGAATPTPTATGTESADGTTLNSTTGSIVDANLVHWTLVTSATLGLQIARDGVLDTTTSNVVLLYYGAHQVYQENSAGNWYVWSGVWTQTTDPRGVTAPPPGANFSIKNGLIYDPSGVKFIARGINVYDSAMGTVSTSTSCTPLLTLFPKLNFVRLACFSYNAPSFYKTFIDQLTAKKIVVELEHHSGAGGGVPPLTGQALTDENTWFQNLATTYKSNPYVWFGTLNEPGGPGSTLTAEQVSNYNTIRNAGNNSIIMLEVLGDYADGLHYQVGSGHGLTPDSSYAVMTNIVWDFHFYNGLPHFNATDGSGSYSTDQTTLNNLIAGYISQCQTIKSKDGTVPVIIGEYGISTDDQTLDPGGTQTCIAVQQSGVGSAAWNWNSYAKYDILTVNDNALTDYGKQVAGWINA